MITARQRAEEQQRRASDPAVSAFVAASAGSGKTKLLTDRLLRLMLGGAEPGRVLCLTFTKAAAAEMALRLQKRLGAWVTQDDATLDEELRRLDIAPDPATRQQARALFARVLDQPGGMRISTIHAFCQSLLRRFPLEAQLSPHFQLVEDADAATTLREAQEEILAEAHTPERRGALERLAGLLSAGEFNRLVANLRADPAALLRAAALDPDALATAQRRALGVTASDLTELMRQSVCWPAEDELRAAARHVAAASKAKKVAERAESILGWLGRHPEARAECWVEWKALFLTQGGKPCAPSSLVNDVLAKDRPDLREPYLAEQTRILDIEDSIAAAQVADISCALLRLALPMAAAFERRKESGGLLEYDDLIGRTSHLLVDPGAAWVLYKLDGGLDHLLLDEVQDTAPAQWKIARALTEEFFAGQGAHEGAREQLRTVFAVGDRKQSIYSFQGADVGTFDVERARLKARVEQAGQPWRDVGMDVSFRSTTPVLQLVDAVFSHPDAVGGVVGESDPPLIHVADRAGHAGAVELWPLAPRPAPTEAQPWDVPDSYQSRTSALQLLADGLAGWIAGQVGRTRLESKGRPLEGGDVLVLVRRRNELPRALVRALKSRGVAVAGLDRLRLTDQPAVADLLALCDTLLLPQDDLSVACVLTSPLGNLSDCSLMELAMGRRNGLWEALRSRAPERPDWKAAWEFLETLFRRVDYATPHALLAEALGPLGARARLLARLGPEAAEPLDELLHAALVHARAHPPSLQGFVHWLRQSGTEVKREPEGAGGAVRVMTVHGAKGLQAPLVILPDTTMPPRDRTTVLWAEDPEGGAAVPLWSPRKELRCAAAERLREAVRRRQAEEENRLLYVALTRAEDRLVVCGWEPGKKQSDAPSWYELVRQAFEMLKAPVADGVALPWEGGVRRIATSQRCPPDLAPTRERQAAPPLPAWAGQAPSWRPDAPPQEPPLPLVLAPSRPEGVDLGPVPESDSPLGTRENAGLRLWRGELLHALLQHLPDVPGERRAAAARAFLARPGLPLDPDQVEALAAETLAVLNHPALAPLFGPAGRAEVPLTGLVDGVVVTGQVDRLAILPDAVLVADYKTHRAPPERLEDTPVLYLRQMAAYRAVLARIYPERPIRCALVWTQAGRVVPLPPDLLDRHAPGAA